MHEKKLSEILYGICNVSQNDDCEIQNISIDNRRLSAGDLFICYPGQQHDSREFMLDAIEKGVSAIVYEAQNYHKKVSHAKIPLLPVNNLLHYLSHIAANFYNHPAKHLKLIGITGTNGKTSCSHFVASALLQLNVACGVIGTLGYGLPQNLTSTGLTTPDAITLQKILRELVEKKITHVAMEVSSHSIHQGRAAALSFDVGIFTNLTRDHLDYHGTMQNYADVKKSFFENPTLKNAVINIDDELGRTIKKALPHKCITYSVNEASHQHAEVFARHIRCDEMGIVAEVNTPWGNGIIKTPLLGKFNLSNLLAVLSTLCVLEVKFEDALKAISALSPIEGRMQMLSANDRYIVVDFAHTPDALEKVLMVLREHCKGKLWCLFGCGGDRDKGKRPLMAQVVEKYADKIIVTDDNPRTENPESIIQDILLGFSDKTKVAVQHDRERAVKEIIENAAANDYVLLAGKGAEQFQYIGQYKIPYSDITVAKSCLEKINAGLA